MPAPALNQAVKPEVTGSKDGAVLTVSVSVADPVPAAFVALMVTVKLPATVGAPKIAPVLGLTVNPAGNPVAP